MTQATRACPYCSAPLVKPRRVQCGAPECKRQYRNERQRDFQQKWKGEHGQHYSRQYDRPKPKRFPIVCAHCGTLTQVSKADTRHCSHRCWYDAKHARHAQIEPAWKPHITAPRVAPPIITPSRLRRCWYSACCPMCSTWFVTDNPRHRSCTTRCARRADRDKRRALLRDAFVAPVSRIQVYERDRWICQLCRGKVVRDAVAPHPRSPVLDHVLPLSQGGTHEPANVQLAHYHCNSIKSDGVWGAGEQLALIG